jgi:hypothetical protein
LVLLAQAFSEKLIIEDTKRKIDEMKKRSGKDDIFEADARRKMMKLESDRVSGATLKITEFQIKNEDPSMRDSIDVEKPRSKIMKLESNRVSRVPSNILKPKIYEEGEESGRNCADAKEPRSKIMKLRVKWPLKIRSVNLTR